MLRKGMFIGDRYEILEQVGSGGMSDVYKAKCHKLNRFVAVKVLKQEFSEDKNFVSKFKIEAQSAASLSHANIVNVFDVGEENGLYYIVMELIEGITLKKYIRKKGKLSIKETTSIAIQVAQGIECAHNNHIIHRDIKPQNIIISREGKVKVTDFGIARAVSSNTINSNAMGSVHYISPEQARGGYIDEKSDIYSLGITMYEMITGQLPFEGDSTVAIALLHIQGELPELKQLVEDLPISTEKIIYKCTQKKADRRYLKISSLIADLKRSLISPDEDFVQSMSVEMLDDGTRLFDPEEVKAGVTTTPISELSEDEYEEEFDDNEDDIDKINPKLEKIITIGGIIACVVFLVILVMVIIKFTSGSKGGDPYVVSTKEQETLDARHSYMPSLLGKTEEEVVVLMQDANLGYKFIYEKNSEYGKGKICKQEYKEGEVIAKNTTVTITVSEGADKFEAPDYAGQKLDDVLKELEDLGLKSEIEYEYSTTIEINTVISSSPVAPYEIQTGDTIKLVVSRGDQAQGDVTVPSLTGSTKAEAEKKLSNAGLKIGTVTEEEHESIAAGVVIRQGIKSGEKLPSGTTVSIVISSGPSGVSVPSLSNLTQAKAKKELESVGLKLGNVSEEYNSSVSKGKVISQDKTAGVTVDVGSAVNIVISKGVEPTTTPPTEKPTPPKTYSATVSIDKNKLNDNGLLTSGVVEIRVDNEILVLGQYANLSTWPNDVWKHTISKTSATVCSVVATVDGVVKFQMDLPVN